MAKIRLTAEQAEARDREGQKRYDQVVDYGSQNRIVGMVPDLDRERHAAGAELAVAVYFGLPWTGLHGRRSSADVGTNVQVRCRIIGDVHWDKLKLYVHEQVPDDHAYVHVIPTGPNDYLLVGWTFGAAAKQEGEPQHGKLRGGRCRWGVRKQQLLHIETLRGIAA